MAKREIKIIFKKRTAIAISNIALYIEGKGYPITANRFTVKLYKFGNSLAGFPDKYPVCRKKAWAKRNLRCAVFKKNYVFIYKLFNDELVILNVVHVLTIA
jgi:plasmid stabilization system protein ParE